MKANELRIGNWIQSRGVTGEFNNWQVTAEDIPQILDNEHLEDQYRGIPLTEEWLNKFGFVKNKAEAFENIINPYWVKNAVCMFYTDTPPHDTYLGGYGFSGLFGTDTQGKYLAATFQWIQFVHQLQNLYFALTGEELKVKGG